MFAPTAITCAWTKGMIIHAYMKKCIHMVLKRIFVPEGKRNLRSKKASILLVVGS